MADGPGEDGFEALRAGREPRAEPTASAEERRPSGRWRAGAWVLLLLGLLAAAVALVPGWRARLPLAPAAPSADAPAAVRPAPSEAEALAARVAALEARLAEGAATSAARPVAETAITPALAPLLARLEALEAEARRLAEAEAATAGRVSALAADLASAGVTSGAVAAATAEARDIFTVLAVRRLVERGRPLGAFDPLLRRQFETREPSAVAALLAWSRAPLGRAALAARLEALDSAGPDSQPGGAGHPDRETGFWSRLWRGLTGLVEVRSAREPISPPLARARARLAEGDLPAAIALVAAEPESPERAAWLEDARRLLAAEDALDRLDLLVVQAASASAAG